MNWITERRMLAAMLRRIDGNKNAWLTRRWLPPLLWLAIAVSFYGLFSYGNIIGQAAVVVCAALVGNLSGLVLSRRDSARAWPFIAPHINRQSVQDRLEELNR